MSSGEERGLLSRTAAGNRAYCHPRWPALQVIRAAIVSNINSSFLAKFRFPVKMSTREDVSNTVENNRIHKVIGP